jgi:hypothetical protein
MDTYFLTPIPPILLPIDMGNILERRFAYERDLRVEVPYSSLWEAGDKIIVSCFSDIEPEMEVLIAPRRTLRKDNIDEKMPLAFEIPYSSIESTFSKATPSLDIRYAIEKSNGQVHTSPNRVLRYEPYDFPAGQRPAPVFVGARIVDEKWTYINNTGSLLLLDVALPYSKEFDGKDVKLTLIYSTATGDIGEAFAYKQAKDQRKGFNLLFNFLHLEGNPSMSDKFLKEVDKVSAVYQFDNVQPGDNPSSTINYLRQNFG